MEIVKTPLLSAAVLELSPERVRDEKPLIVVSAYASNSTLKCPALESRSAVRLVTPGICWGMTGKPGGVF